MTNKDAIKIAAEQSFLGLYEMGKADGVHEFIKECDRRHDSYMYTMTRSELIDVQNKIELQDMI